MSKSLVCFDIGSDALKMAVFAADNGSLQLDDFAVVNLGIPPDTSIEERNSTIAQTIRFTLEERKLRPKSIHVSLSGQSVFVRFVKLPAVDESKIAQIVRYEAQQQVPFPIEEVEWDHQVIGDRSAEEIDIVLVAMKTEVVSGLVEAIRAQHIEVETVDVSSLSLYNAMVYNEGPFETSTALVDLGARTTNLIIAEGINLWSRAIPIGGENISQAIAQELDTTPEEADKLKRLIQVGATLGDERLSRAGEAAAKVLNRLLAEIRRSIGYYRSQSQGTPVQRVLLSGGGSSIKNIETFLAEKLNVDVAPLSSVARVKVGPRVDKEAVRAQGRLLGDVVGLGLRAAGQGMLHTNLLPKAIVYQRELSKKKVFIVGAAACLVGAMAMLGLNARSNTQALENELTGKQEVLEKWSQTANQIKQHESKKTTIEAQVKEIEKMQAARLYWVDFIEIIKDKKPRNAWFTRIQIEGMQAPTRGSNTRATVVSSMPSDSMGSMGHQPPGSYGPPSARMRSSARVPSSTASSSPKGKGKTSLSLTGYLKLTQQGATSESARAREIEKLKQELESIEVPDPKDPAKTKKLFGNVTLVSQEPIDDPFKVLGEPLAKFTLTADVEVPFEF
ncbi:MAG: type IV pilus assembly protein PilM [Verrucomicrobia bacterium]|nr:type IV pilus assembly protein PilM [Verrucomicrobiota bacterium]